MPAVNIRSKVAKSGATLEIVPGTSILGVGNPPTRPMLGTGQFGWHWQPRVNDLVVALGEVRDGWFTTSVSADTVANMRAMNPGEMGGWAPNGRVLANALNTGATTIFSDPNGATCSILEDTSQNIKIASPHWSVDASGNALIGGTLGVTGLSTLTGGAILGADLDAATHNIKNVASIGAGSAPGAGNWWIDSSGNETLAAAITVGGLATLNGGAAINGASLDDQNLTHVNAISHGTTWPNTTWSIDSGGAAVFASDATLGNHIVTNGTAPSFAAGAGSTAASVVGTDIAGVLTFTMNNVAYATQCFVDMGTLTFHSAYGATIKGLSLTIVNGAFANPATYGVFVARSIAAGSFAINFTIPGMGTGSINFGSAQTMKVSYIAIG